MITTIRTFTRPSTAVAWWHDSTVECSAFNERMRKDFIDTRKIIDRKVDNDGLTITVIIQWVNKTAMNAHYNDANNVAYFALRDAYNTANGITTTFSQV